MSRLLIERSLLGLSVLTISSLVASSAYAGVIGGDLGDSGIGAGGVWQQDPDSGMWSSPPIGIPNDPNGYIPELACATKDGDLKIQCSQQCDAADGGMLVFWLTGLKGTDATTWDYLRANGAGSSRVSGCIYSEKPRDVLDEIAEIILEEFQQRPVDAGALTLQPNPHTLIRANTNFFVQSKNQVFDLELLGQDVKIKATPTEYTWNYGDGSTYGPTRESGYVLRDDELGEETQTSHQYPETGDYQVSVTVHFTGEYSVNDGPMIPIDGRGEFSTPSQTISVWKSESRLVDGTCLDDPAGWGC